MDCSVTAVRILVVEDFQAFRQFLCSSLQNKTEWQVICEVSDGLEAINKAAALQPDLILLDIGLPKLKGMDVGQKSTGVGEDIRRHPHRGVHRTGAQFCTLGGGVVG